MQWEIKQNIEQGDTGLLKEDRRPLLIGGHVIHLKGNAIVDDKQMFCEKNNSISKNKIIAPLLYINLDKT